VASLLVPFPTPPTDPAAAAGGETVEGAVDRYLDSVQTATTRASYAETLARLTALAGNRLAATLTPEEYAAVMDRWDEATAATWNRHLSALTSFTAWAGRQEILDTNPGRRLERRKPARHCDRSIPRARLDKLFTDNRHDLRGVRSSVADCYGDPVDPRNKRNRWAKGQGPVPQLRDGPLPRAEVAQIAVTCSACGPFGPCVVVNSTRWFSSRLR
jgi:hypothetical protein